MPDPTPIPTGEVPHSTKLWSQVVVHELRERIAVIKAYCGLLQPGVAQPAVDLPDLVGRLDRAILRIEQLARDLAELTRATTDGLVLSRYVLDLVSLCREAAEEQALSSGRYLLLDLPDDSVFIEGDPTRLSQLICNLALTASRHASFGNRVRLILRQEGATARLVVRDSCGGIPQSQMAYMFDPLHHPGEARSDSAVTLYLCRLLTEAHGGKIRASSEAGIGCTYTVELPINPGFLDVEVRT